MLFSFFQSAKSKVEIFMRGSSHTCILYLVSKLKTEERRIIQTLNNLQLRLSQNVSHTSQMLFWVNYFGAYEAWVMGRLQDKDIAELSWDRNKLVFEENGSVIKHLHW